MVLSRDSVKGISWFLAIGVAFFYLVIGRIYYVTNDDCAFVQITSGARCAMYRDMPVFCNVLFAKGLAFLYDLCYPVNWFVVLQCVLSLFCFAWMNIRILRNHLSVFTIILCLILDIVIGEFHFFRFQFTHNAYLFSICGMLAIIHGCRRHDCKPWFDFLFGFIAILAGGMIRLNAFICSFLLCLGWGIYQMAKSRDRKINLRIPVAFLVIVALIAVLWLYDKQNYQTAEWKEYRERNAQRALIQDIFQQYAQAYTLQRATSPYEQAEWNCISKWIIGNSPLANSPMIDDFLKYARTERAQKLKRYDTFVKVPYGVFEGFAPLLFGSCFGWAIILLVFLHAVPLKTLSLANGRQRLLVQGAFVVFLIATGFFLHAYLLVWLDRCIFRAYYGYWLFLALVMAISINKSHSLYHLEEKLVSNAWLKIVMAIICIGLCFPCLGASAIQTLRYRYRFNAILIEYKACLAELQRRTDSIYLILDTCPAAHNAYHPFVTPALSLGKNCIPLSGWDIPSPRICAMRNAIGCPSPFDALLENKPALFIVSQNPEVIGKYLETHYNVKASLKCTEILNSQKIWKCLTTRPDKSSMDL